ncbi:MAG: hypothetical protein M3515_09385, partial [Actinomycetota bacterium]|nr:hypothetical protein [Actinomycetota bacterium]
MSRGPGNSFQQILDVRVSQRIGQEIVNGGGSTNLICDGTTRTYEVSAAPFNPPASSGRPFKRGEALVTASTNTFNSGDDQIRFAWLRISL